ncbi:MAG: hypothetical protein KKD38_01205, partial [Candidatus Delongbacteria bacterium]|nr:hypothetical protein [Candidatus Delongbacteria bacterium]
SGLLARYKYNDTFKKYEISDINTMTGNVGDVIVHNDMIYMCSPSGLYFISENSSNINYLNNWSTVSGLEAGTIINSFAVGDDKLYALSNNGLYSISDSIISKESVFENEVLYSGMFYNDKFYASLEQVDATVIKSVNKDLNGTPEIVFGTDETDSKNFRFRVLNNTIYFTSSSGYSYYDILTDTEGPENNFNTPKEKGIKKAIIDQESGNILYLTSNKFSYLRMSDNSFHEKMFSARGSATNIHANGDGLFICTWGAGVNYFEREDTEYVYKKKYSFGSAKGVSTRYPVHPGIAEDREGNIWITNWNDYRPDSVVTVLSAEGIVENSFAPDNFVIAYDIFVDYYKNQYWVWLGSSSQAFGQREGVGVGIYDGQSLPIKQLAISEGIIDILRDKQDIVWIATNNGIKYIDLGISQQGPTSLSLSNVNSIQLGPIGNVIFDVEVNSINEKWFATNKGVSVLSPDNFKWRHYVPKYFIESTPVTGEIIRTDLFDDVINDIVFDEKNGIAILSSSNGLTFLEYGKIFKTDKVSKGEIQTKPSPFINDGSSIMGFYFPEDGNSYDIANIFDLKGFLVRGGDGSKELDIQNGWDGRDNNGKIVSTGIYQVIVYNKNDNTKNIVGKIAVVRK